MLIFYVHLKLSSDTLFKRKPIKNISVLHSSFDDFLLYFGITTMLKSFCTTRYNIYTAQNINYMMLLLQPRQYDCICSPFYFIRFSFCRLEKFITREEIMFGSCKKLQPNTSPTYPPISPIKPCISIAL